MSEPRSCPFCGAAARVVPREHNASHEQGCWYVACEDFLHCPYSPLPINSNLTRNAAIAAWNGPNG